MDNIAAEEQAMADFWYTPKDKLWSGAVPSGYDKVYRYGTFRDVILYKYKKFVIVHYEPTGMKFKFDDIGEGFQFARDRANHVKAGEALLGV